MEYNWWDIDLWDLKAKGLFFLLFLRRSAHSSWGLLRCQSRVRLNRSGSLTGLCMCVSSCMSVHERSDWRILLVATGKGSSGLCLFFHFVTFPPPFYLSILIFSIRFVFFHPTVGLPPNSAQSLDPLILFPVLINLSLTSTRNLLICLLPQSFFLLSKGFMAPSTVYLPFSFCSDI